MTSNTKVQKINKSPEDYLDIVHRIRAASRLGRVDNMRALMEKFGLTAADARSDDNRALRPAAEKGHVHILQFMKDALRFQFICSIIWIFYMSQTLRARLQ